MLEVEWTYAAHHPVQTLLVDGDDCFVASHNTRLVSLNTADGRERWRVRIENPWGWVAATKALVFYLNQHSLLIAVDRANGQLLWSLDLRGVWGWLHAFGDRVIVGGWRGYTDILALDPRDGHICWTYPARDDSLNRIHSTRIHAESSTLVVARSRERRALVFLDLGTGNQILEFPVDHDWNGDFSERPRGTGRPGRPVVIESGPDGFLVIADKSPTVERISVPAEIWSMNLRCTGAFVPFIRAGGVLCVWSMAERRIMELGGIEHNRRDLLPFCEIPGSAVAVGTSRGRLGLYPRPGVPPAWLRVGKRVSTDIVLSSSLLIFGTDSGDVLGVRTRGAAEAMSTLGP